MYGRHLAAPNEFQTKGGYSIYSKYRYFKDLLKTPTRVLALAESLGVSPHDLQSALETLVKLKLVDKFGQTFVNRRNPYRIKAGDKYLTPAEVVLVFHPSNTKLTEDIYGVLSCLMVSLADVHHSNTFTVQDYLDDLDSYIQRYELRLQAIKFLRKFLVAFRQHYMVGMITSYMELEDEDLDDLKESAEDYERRNEPQRIRATQEQFEQFDAAIRRRVGTTRKFAVRGRDAAREIARTPSAEERRVDEEAKRVFKETIARLKARASGETS